MSYRRNRPSGNILRAAATEVFAGLGALLTAALLFSGAGCEREGKPASAMGAPPAQRGTPDASATSGLKLRFDPAKADHSDLAVEETVVERIALKSETPVDWRTIEVDSSCECLLARFVETTDPKRALVELTFNSDKLEDVDGMVYARLLRSKEEIEKNGFGDMLATYTARVVTKRKPFVVPRSIVLEKGGSGSFELIVGQAFPHGVKTPVSIFNDVHFDEAKLDLSDQPLPLDPISSESQELLRTRIPFVVIESARATAFTTKVKLEFGVPPVEKSVEVEWR